MDEDLVSVAPVTRPWLGPLVAVVVGAVFAVGASVGLGVAVGVPEVPEVGTVVSGAPGAAVAEGGEEAAASEDDAPPAVARRLSEAAYLDGILARNLFDPSRIGVVEASEEAAGGGASSLPPLNVQLLGTIVAEPETFSAAFIQEQGKTSAWAFGIGQTVQGAVIVRILDDRVLVDRNGTEDWITLDGEKPKEPERGSPTVPARPVTGGDEVKQLDENSFILDRGMVEKQLEDLAGLSSMGRALLHRGPDGQYDGYRLSAIRRGSLADQMGIRNGDIIHSINGIPMNSLEGAMQAYEKLRSESNLEVEVTRRGQPTKLGYTIQ